ncbi:MAG: glycoside hydrolase family 15 protein [Candidatus Microthrix subdominans]|nr:glycoside hydrolase family 15 protein [Candidatus Microthrix sp.]MBP9064504.1 glycoside hydrolase family 15 protein [Candidatus Microthrix sp.]
MDAVDEAVRGASRPIEDLGMIGDTRTAALVGSDGSIDWMCIPSFDGSPVFGRLVGGVAAGRFRMGPNAPATVIDREYRHETATLRTTWVTDAGRLTLTEAMVSEVAGRFLPTTLLVRRLSAVEGPVEVGIEFDPRLGERHVAPRVERRGDVTVCSWGAEAMALTCSANLDLEPGGTHTVTIEAGEDLTIVVGVADHEPLIYVDPARAWAAVCDDERGWRSWCADIPDDIPHRDTVVRSLLTLRLLTYSPSGAPVAAPTTSLPEDPGGIRNWDYRFAWPRDASIGIGAFLGVGKDDEARHFLAWLLHASRRDRPRLPVLLTLHGRHPRGEGEMTGWPGYANSRPVRVGNGAADQHQLDGYGWVIDAAWLLTAAGHGLYTETWRALRGFVDEVVARWRDPDAGIWEVRGDEAHHVHSKLMAWLALDRALAISATQRTPKRQQDAWRRERAALAADIAAHGYNDVVGAYTRTYGSDDLDAAVLVLPLLGVEPAASERIRSTVAAIRRELGAGGPLVYRYPPGEDGLPGGEGAFLPCSFWLVQALALTGDVSEARSVFDELVAMAGPLGLFAEEVDPETGAFIGNFPQALSHASLVQAALALRGAGSSAS